MNLFSLFLRCCRRLFRILNDFVVYIRFRLMLVLNSVEHETIASHGLPYIAVMPGGKCTIGNNFIMNNGVRFNPIGFAQPCYIVVTKDAKLSIGQNVGMSQTSLICHHSITIGNNVKFGGGVKVYDTNFHSLDPFIRRNHDLDMEKKKCLPVFIEHDSFIGAGTIVLAGVTIGANAVIGAGSVVTKSVPENEVWGGNPAHFIKILKV